MQVLVLSRMAGEGVVEAAAEERSAPRGIHVSHGWVEGVGDMVFGRKVSLVKEGVHIPEMAFSTGQRKQGSGRGKDVRRRD
jgi:hypothetical protein